MNTSRSRISGQPSSLSAIGCSGVKPIPGGGGGGGGTWTADERFAYFRSKLCRSALWGDSVETATSDCSAAPLFDRLRGAARARMADLAALCDVRFRELLAEPGAAALLAEAAPAPSDLDTAGSRAGSICRQDHPEVCLALMLMAQFFAAETARTADAA